MDVTMMHFLDSRYQPGVLFAELIPKRAGWVLMESPSPVLMFLFFWTSRANTLPLYVFAGCWLTHYIQRTWVYPFIVKAPERPMNIIASLAAVAFNFLNAPINAVYMFYFARTEYANDYVTNWWFWAGLLIWAAGFVGNIHSDRILRNLKRGPKGEYAIPRGGLFEYVSAANYSAELFEWTGYAIMTASPAAWMFVVWTAANLVPRAVRHHNGYVKQFGAAYPKKRAAVIPFIW
eukprot:TRINITY_DN2019_c0_g1_i1.p1 TRINITY_DN2019_c0_g1~~TRINITY_DN2019_c0_g1_i1.p1  ORF type:complete len:234 (+),score=18.59 TRINITY_DN2019_c0_g1_i1:220-921(+)